MEDGAPDFGARCKTIFLGHAGERDLDFYYLYVQLLILKPEILTSDCFIRYALFKRYQRHVDFCSQNLINNEEFLLSYDLNKSSNLDLPDCSYDQFDLDLLTDDECKSEFRLYRKDVYLLAKVLQVPDQIRCYNRVVVDGITVLCIFLQRFAYPCRYSDMLSRFARPVP